MENIINISQYYKRRPHEHRVSSSNIPKSKTINAEYNSIQINNKTNTSFAGYLPRDKGQRNGKNRISEINIIRRSDGYKLKKKELMNASSVGERKI